MVLLYRSVISPVLKINLNTKNAGYLLNNSPLPNLITYNNTINYADGSESKLLSAVSDPNFDEFTSWRAISDWAQYYHLSPLRRNLLNWINFGNKPLRILELGAGCGAITSFLVTIPSSDVVAVEGALDRANVIRFRCKNADNLQIHACPINEFNPDNSFDIIILIGVLEYAGCYETAKDPFKAVLSKAADMLSEDGILIVAIENQLGCKYISGCPEDHYGVPYEGLNGYPNYNGIKTFTLKTLSQKLDNAGLDCQKWFYPYPDYKLPSVIFSETAFRYPGFDWIALTDVPPEPNENSKPTFNDRSFLSLIQQTGTVNHFMNSFLIFAGKGNNLIIDNHEKILAVKSNVKFRTQSFQTSTVFSKDSDKISVFKKRLFPNLPTQCQEIKLNIDKSGETYYNDTINIFDAILKEIQNRDYEKTIQYFNTWVEILQEYSEKAKEQNIVDFRNFSKKSIGQPIYEKFYNDEWIKGTFIDLVPLNILIPVNKAYTINDCKVIDREWEVSFDIPVQLVFDRGFFLLSNKLLNILKPSKNKVNKISLLPNEIHELLKNNNFFRNRQALDYNLFENWFQQGIITGFSSSLPEHKNHSHQTESLQFSINHFMSNIVTLVEQGNHDTAILYYDKNRSLFPDEAQLIKFDEIIASLRKKLNQNRTIN